MSPQVPHTLEFLHDKLSRRTLRELTTLHFTHFDSEYHCLDLDLIASDLGVLVALVSQKLLELEKNQILPSAPKEQWDAIWGKKMEWRRVFQPLQNKVTGNYVAVVMVNL